MAVTAPPVNDELGPLDPPADQMDSDLDAEGEEETDLYQMDQQLQDAVHRAYSGEEAEEIGDSGADGEIMRTGAKNERVGGDNDNDETEPVGAVKLPEDEESSDEEDAESGIADADVDPAFEEDNDQDASEPSDSESEADDWEAESNGQGDADADIRSRANCM